MERLANRVMLLSGFKRTVLTFLAGAMGALALPPFDFFAAMFPAFVLLVWLLDGAAAPPGSGFLRRLWPSFWTGWLFGFGYFVAGLWWLGHALMIDAEEFAWALPLAVLGLPAFLACYYGLGAVIARLLYSDGLGRIAALAFGLGLMEWVRSFAFTGFPWNAIGYGIMPVPLMMQSVHVIGTFGVTTLAVFIFASPALLGTRQGVRLGLSLSAILFVAHLGYGYYAMSRPLLPVRDGKTVTVRLVQPNIGQDAKMDTNADRTAIFEAHLRLSAAAPADGAPKPDIIVWPETAVPFILTDNKDALARIADVLDDNQLLLTGVVRLEEGSGGSPPRYYNSIYTIDGKGQILSAADKVHLVPFGEYLPFENILQGVFGLENVIELPGGFTAAAQRSMLNLPDGLKLYPLICYEIIFPGEMTPAIASADAIVNITNDAWYGNTPGPYQHFQQARVRAVEEGLPLLRDGNNGISALIDPYGRVVSGLGLNQTGFVDATLGGRAGDAIDDKSRMHYFWLVLGSMVLIALISRLSFVRSVD